MDANGQRPRPTLEQLLQLKRLERPSIEFWEEFQRGLDRKRLLALVRPPSPMDGVLARLAPLRAFVLPATAAGTTFAVVLLAAALFRLPGHQAGSQLPVSSPLEFSSFVASPTRTTALSEPDVPMEARFVLDVIDKAPSGPRRFVTEASPATLQTAGAAGSPQYAVYTMTTFGAANPF